MTNYLRKLKRYSCFFYGLLLPLSFAPFHMPGFAIIALALFYNALTTEQATHSRFQGFWQGLAFGCGVFGLGTSWIYVSIHQYGHLTPILSAFITLVFILYLSLFPAAMSCSYQYLRIKPYTILSISVFAALWTLSEYLRATFLTGFPWLIVGMGQIDTPLRNLLPYIGVYGVSFLTVMASGFLVLTFKVNPSKRLPAVLALLFIILSPQLLHLKKEQANPAVPEKTLNVAVVQSNISMRDKWDEQLFWKLLAQYQKTIQSLLGTDLIVLPESALPVPEEYIQDILKRWSQEAKNAGSAVLIGIPKASTFDDTLFYNALIALGKGKGSYLKQHVVPFGEYYPKPFRAIAEWLSLPEANMQPGSVHQRLVSVHHVPIATLICYELAYGDLLRKQLPKAQLIVSLSDDGWFGHSLAVYQHQQMAQVQSLQTNRYQVLANNDGLSSVIDDQGTIKSALLAFSSGILKATLIPRTTLTPWVSFGDYPALLVMSLITLFSIARRVRKIKAEKTEDFLLPSEPRDAILTGQLEIND